MRLQERRRKTLRKRALHDIRERIELELLEDVPDTLQHGGGDAGAKGATHPKLEQDWGFSDAILSGDTVYLSGVVAGVREGESDLRLGYTRAFERIGEILKNVGASWDDVVEIMSFHTDLTTQMPAIVAVKNIYVKPPFPAWTAIQVSRLIPSNGITEIRIVAKLRK